MAATSTTAFPLLSGLKVEDVEIWGPMASDLKPVTVSVEYPSNVSGALSGPSRITSDSSMGSTSCAHVKVRPPAGSAASFWLSPGNDNIIILNAPANSIVDVTLSCTLADGANALVTGPLTVAGATAGDVLMLSLDSAGAKLLVPISYSTV
jgi:hypothetical protein